MTNFDLALPPGQSDLARDLLKDPYKLDFLGLGRDAQVKDEADGPTIGLLLCKGRDEVVAEYALRDTSRALGISEYQLIDSLPADVQSALPTIEQIERELDGRN